MSPENRCCCHREVSFAIIPANLDPHSSNFFSWYSKKPNRHRHRNYFPKFSPQWNKTFLQEFLYQMFVPKMNVQYFEANSLSPTVVFNLFLVWIEEMASFLVELSPTIGGLAAAISSRLLSCKNLSLCSWTRNPLVLSKILHACQGGAPLDVIHFVVPGSDNIFGPWLQHYIAKYHGWSCMFSVQVPFRLEDKNPPELNNRFRIKRQILREKTRLKEGDGKDDLVVDPTRVEVPTQKGNALVVVRSKFSVMVRFLFWFLRQSKIDEWTSLHLSFQTEYYLSGFFRIVSVSQLEAEIDWLIAWVGDNDMTSYGLPSTILQVDVLTSLKKAIRSESLPLDNFVHFGYQTYCLDQIIPSTLSCVDNDLDMTDKLSLLLLEVKQQDKDRATQLYHFVSTHVRVHFGWLPPYLVEWKIDNFLFRLIYHLQIVTLLDLQNVVEDLVDLSKHTNYLCCEIIRLLSEVLRCEQPRCFAWDDSTWRKVDENGHDLLCPNSIILSGRSTQASLSVSEADLTEHQILDETSQIEDDYVRYGG